jgi:hypothetical protein
MNRIFPLAIGAALLAFAGVQSYGFMLASVDIVPTTDLLDAKTIVLSLQEDFENEDITCEQKFASVESAIEDIDLALDAGTADEENLLEARETLVEMQSTLPCAQTLTALVDGPILGNGPLSGQGGLLGGNTASGSGLLGGNTSVGGGLGGAGGGIGGTGFGLIGAIAAGVAIPVAVSGGGEEATVDSVD